MDRDPTPTPLKVELSSVKESFDSLITKLAHKEAELDQRAAQLKKERESLEREKASLLFHPPPHAPSAPSPNAAVNRANDFTLCPNVLVIEDGGKMFKTESIVEFLNRNAHRNDEREPDTPHPGHAQTTPNKLGIAMDLDPTVNHIASQSSLAMFQMQLKQQVDSGTTESEMVDVANKVLSYCHDSFDNGRFRHTKQNVQVLANVLKTLSAEVSAICSKEPVLLKLNAPLFVFGDIHGNFADLSYFTTKLLHFDSFDLTAHSFLFLGDFVDRGMCSIECVAYLWALKVKAPNRVWLLRGNHEDWQVNGDEKVYGDGCFKSNCRALWGREMGDEMWNIINASFKDLPLAAMVNDKVFCCHGGIPRYSGGPDNRIQILSTPGFPHFNTFTTQQQEDAKRAAMRQMAFDLVWSDPSDTEEGLDQYGFGSNPRGGDIRVFGIKAVQTFLHNNNLQFILRAHQEKSDGLKVSKHSKVVTIFSSSGYCGHGNGAGVVFIGEDGKLRMVVKTHTDETSPVT